MPDYIQKVLDMIEWANGSANSRWGAVRAAAGHSEPFNLQYLGVGNEDHITPVFKERFQMIHEAIAAKYPEITVIGTVGPFPDGDDYNNGWKIADDLHIRIVDEHYYKSPQWFWDNLKRYDQFDRSGSKVYVGEYAAHDDRRRTTLRSALAEAACLSSLERNGDIVVMASYAPLLAKRGHTDWNPDLIYFSNTEVIPTINYYVQQLFSLNCGDTFLPSSVTGLAGVSDFATSFVRDRSTGDIILKLVNGAAVTRALSFELDGVGELSASATLTVLAGENPLSVNDFPNPQTVVPHTSTLAVGARFDYEAPPYSLSIIRITPGSTQ